MNKSKRWLLIAFLFSSFAEAKRCYIMYDPKGLGHGPAAAPFISQVSGILDDPDCTELTLFPPIPSLYPVRLNEFGDYQPQIIPLTTEARQWIKYSLQNESFQTELSGKVYTPVDLRRFNEALKKEGGADKSVFIFHGSSNFAAMTFPANPMMNGIFHKDIIYSNDALVLANSNLELSDYIIQKLKDYAVKKKHEGPGYPNPCLSRAKKVGEVSEKFFTEAAKLQDPLAKFLGEHPFNPSKNVKLICADYSKMTPLMENLLRGARSPEYCAAASAFVEAQTRFTTCVNNFLNVNLLYDEPLLASNKDSKNLVLSCAIGSDEVSPVIDNFALSILRGCKEGQQTYEEKRKKEREGSSLKTAEALCLGVEDGSQISVGLNLNSSGQPTAPIEKSLRESGAAGNANVHPLLARADLANANNTYMGLAGICEKEVRDASKLMATFFSKQMGIQAISEGDLAAFAEARSNFLADKLCSEKGFDNTDKADLRDLLVKLHSKFLFGQYAMPATYERGMAGDALQNKEFLLQDAKVAKMITAGVEKSYKNIDLDTQEGQLKALARLDYLVKEVRGSSGYYDCYRCDGGKPTLISCDSMKKSFSHASYVGDRDSYNVIRNFEHYMKSFEASVAQAATQDPLICRNPMPKCDTCGPGKKQHKKAAPTAPVKK